MAALPPQSPFSSREFRDALGQFATGVTIVTARSPQGHPVGVTVSSFNSVSLTPPLVLWSMALSAASLPVFQHCSHYAIHVLSASQKDRKSTRLNSSHLVISYAVLCLKNTPHVGS